jgi:hypothetical protein
MLCYLEIGVAIDIYGVASTGIQAWSETYA